MGLWKRLTRPSAAPTVPPAYRSEFSADEFRAVYFSSLSCCAACDALDDGKQYLPDDPTFPEVVPPPNCAHPERCACTIVGIHHSEQDAVVGVVWSEWSAARLAERS